MHMIYQFIRFSKKTALALALYACHAAYAQPSNQPTYESPKAAGQSLFDAVQRNDEAAICKILGGPNDLISSSSPEQDKIDRELFVQKYREMNRIKHEPDGSATLYIGVENWPFPIPLVRKDGGWRFDPETGAKEVTFRRIGENELAAIATCHEFIRAELDYRTNGSIGNPEESSPASLVAKTANGSTKSESVLLHGYYFKVMATTPAKGKFALIAYPAAYRASGVMTFVVTEKNVVYEKDLGADSSTVAKGMGVFHKDSSWRAAVE